MRSITDGSTGVHWRCDLRSCCRAARRESGNRDNRPGDLYRIFLTAQRDGLDFNLAYIPTDFNAPHKEEFDREYMQALFERGYRMAAGGYPWEKTPPRAFRW